MLILLFVCLSLSCVQLSAGPGYGATCAPELRSIWQTLQKLPEARQLIASVLNEGPLNIQLNRHVESKFGAFWAPEYRTILVNPPQDNESYGFTIGSIIFELHNALADKELTRLDQRAAAGKLSKNQYIEAVERVEYRNAHQASKIANSGIVQGLFPATAYLHVYPTFEEHFRVQVEAGHSAWIGRTYDQLR